LIGLIAPIVVIVSAFTIRLVTVAKQASTIYTERRKPKRNGRMVAFLAVSSGYEPIPMKGLGVSFSNHSTV
jgi:hypothetical protein